MYLVPSTSLIRGSRELSLAFLLDRVPERLGASDSMTFASAGASDSMAFASAGASEGACGSFLEALEVFDEECFR